MTSNNTESDMNESKMAESKMQGFPPRLAELFEPYAGVTLSALDNLKLLNALANQAALS